MTKRLFTRLKALLTVSRLSVYTRTAKSDKPNFSPEPRSRPVLPEDGAAQDDWMFETASALDQQTRALAGEMDTLADRMGGLRETLALISGEAPFPVEATTLTPCAYIYADTDLFDGEILPETPGQDTVLGGNDAFLFDEVQLDEQSTPASIELESDEARHAA
ncbi:MAG: hypothetical protein AAF613_00690 [Pseudomonadota bacterium]